MVAFSFFLLRDELMKMAGVHSPSGNKSKLHSSDVKLMFLHHFLLRAYYYLDTALGAEEDVQRTVILCGISTIGGETRVHKSLQHL